MIISKNQNTRVVLLVEETPLESQQIHMFGPERK